MADFRKFLADSISNRTPVFFDGGMGTMIQKTGVVGYSIPEDYYSKFKNCLKALNDDNYPQISSCLFDIYGQYKKTGQELAHSLDFRMEAERSIANNFLHEISNELKDLSKVIESKTINEKFTNKKNQLAKEFLKLSKSFQKGEF